MKKIEIYLGIEDGKPAIGIKVRDRSASIEDLLQAWQPLCDDSDIFKIYAEDNHGVCKGCPHNCCNTAYVIPDLISFRKMAAHLNLDYAEFIDNYFHKEKVAVGLLRMKPDPCIFLQDNVCTIYPLRSLICRFYLCCKLMGETEQLIYSLSWTGSAATLVFAAKEGLINSNSSEVGSSFDLMFKKLLEQYRFNPGVELFLQAKEYSDIPLQPFLEDLY